MKKGHLPTERPTHLLLLGAPIHHVKSAAAKEEEEEEEGGKAATIVLLTDSIRSREVRGHQVECLHEQYYLGKQTRKCSFPFPFFR